MTASEDAVAAEILRIAREELRIEATPAPSEPLASALDSLALLALAVAVEDRFRVILTEEDAAAARTVEELARLVAARTAPELIPAATAGGASS